MNELSEDFETAVQQYHISLEQDEITDRELSRRILEQDVTREALTRAKDGIIVELGPYKGIFLEQLWKHYSELLGGCCCSWN